MKFDKIIYIAIISLLVINCKKDDDSSFEEILEPTNEIVGSLWMSSGNTFSELDLKTNQEINSFTTLDSFQCTEFDGTFICTQGRSTDTKTLLRKGTFNGELLWTKEYVTDSEKYFNLYTTEVHQNMVLVSYAIVNSTTFNSTYHLEALDLVTGELQWSIELINQVKRLAKYKNQVIAELSYGSSTTELLSINTSDGNIDSRIPFTDRIGKLVGGTASIFVMTWGNSVISFDENLNENWVFNTDNPNILGGYEVGNQFLFYSRDQTVYSIDTSNGSLIWKRMYTGDYPLGISTLNDKVYISNREDEETSLQIKTLDLISGEELDSYTYSTSQELNTSDTKHYFFDQHLLLFEIAPSENNANITLINITDKTLVWKKDLDQVAYSHLIITPTGHYQ